MKSLGKKRPSWYYYTTPTYAWWFIVYDPPTVTRKFWRGGEPPSFRELLLHIEGKIRDIFPLEHLGWQFLGTEYLSEDAANLVHLPAVDYPKAPAQEYKVYGFLIQNHMKPEELQALSSLFWKYGFESRLEQMWTPDTRQRLYNFDYS